MARNAPPTTRRPLTLAPVVAALCCLASAAAVASAADSVKEVRPILEASCFKCHGEKKQKGGVDFAKIADDRAAARQRKMLRKAIAQVESGEMPPEDEKPLTPEQKTSLLTWMNKSVATIDTTERNPGPSLIHRLNVAEYNNTIRDLLGIDFDAGLAVGMTEEGTGVGYGKLAASLTLSPPLMDKYFAAADKALDRLFATELSSDYDGDVKERAKRAMAKLRTPLAPGAAERDAGKTIIAGFTRRAFRRPVKEAEVDRLMALYDRAAGKGQPFETGLRLMMKAVLVSPHFLFRIEQDRAAKGSSDVYAVSDHELASRLSYFIWSSMPDDQLLELADRGRLTAAGPSGEPVKLSGKVIGDAAVPNWEGGGRDKVFDGDEYTFMDGPTGNGTWAGLDLGEARKVTRVRFIPRAGQEPRMVGGRVEVSSTADFSGDVVELFTITEKPAAGMTMREVTVAKPYRYVRYIPPANSYGNIAELELWGPGEGTVLEQQVRRMLADPKAHALTEQFAVQWLQLNKLFNARPSTEFFPTFNADLKKAMYDEATLFVDALRTEDRSVLELLDADYTFVNEELAKHYGIAGVTGKQMRRVGFKPEAHRGGVLAMGGVLALTSHVSRTSPTLRGKYVLEVLFGTPPPPPPANAGTIKDEQEKGKEPRTFREKLAMHSTDPVCANCHKRMDPLGFALDNYDAVGAWRDTAAGKPLDTTGVLPTGEKMSGAADLKAILLKRRDDFERNLIEQLMVFALGRELDYYDDGPVQAVKSGLETSEHRFARLVMGIAGSYPMLHRRNIDSIAEVKQQP
jgi:hypothetical protein